MAWFTWIVLLISAAVCSIDATRIIGGETTTIENYPSLVQVETREVILWTQTCAASVLTSVHVVSAAHCFAGLLFSVANRRIRAGTSNRGSGGIVINVISAINHPSYSHLSPSNDGDISIVRLETFLVFSPQIQQVAIVPQGFELPDNLPVVHAGWGATSEEETSSSVLREVTVYTINHDVCAARYQILVILPRVTENMICAGVLDVGGKDTCDGDNGGPLYYGNFLVGIVSWKNACADPEYPSVNTRIASYTDWIVETAV